jgi:hypothetical protein
MAELIHEGFTCMCPHGASVTATASSKKVKLGGQAAVTISDTFTVSGCPFQVPAGPSTKPQPCVKVQWIVPAKRVMIDKKPALLKDSSNISLSAEQIPQGSASVTVCQMKVKGT